MFLLSLAHLTALYWIETLNGFNISKCSFEGCLCDFLRTFLTLWLTFLYHRLSFEPHKSKKNIVFSFLVANNERISKAVPSSSVEFLIRPNNIQKVMLNIIAWSLTGNTCCLNAKCSICQLVCYTILLHWVHHDPNAFWQPLLERRGYSCTRCAGHKAFLLLRRKWHCSDFASHTDWILWNEQVSFDKTMELN